MSNFLNELNNFSRKSLKKTTTKIYYLNGKHYVKNSDESDEKETQMTEEDKERLTSSAYWSRMSGFIIQIEPDLTCDQVIDRLYISGDDVALNKDILNEKKITHIVNITSNIPNKFESDFVYMRIILYDLHSQEINKHFQDTYQFIENALNEPNNCVLVHCNAGVSRSATIIIAYLLQKRMFKTFNEAYDFLKTKRCKVCPNDGFQTQLLALEFALNQQI